MQQEVSSQELVRKASIITQPLLVLLALLTVIGLLNTPIIITLWRHSFDDGTYSHAYLIPPIIIYLYYLLAHQNKLLFRQQVSPIAITLLLASAIGLYITSNAQLSLGYWFMLLFLVLTSIANLYRFNWYLLVPAGMLIFIMPLWGTLTTVLQDLSVVSVSFLMGFTGIPVFVEAPFVHIPEGTFEIANGCSGLRYFIVSLAISVLYIFLYIKQPKRAFYFLSVAIIGALLTNWIRITLLILIGHYTDMTSGLMEDHNSFGWYIFIPFMILLFMLGNKLADHDLSHITNANNESQHPINKLNLIFIAIALVASSTSLTNLVHNTTNNSTGPSSPAKIYYANHIENGPLTTQLIKSQHIIYRFDGNDLDGKPSFFEHQFIPDDWTVTSKKFIGDWQVFLIQKGYQKALIAISYQLGSFSTGSSRAFKMYRLKHALSSKQKTNLHWLLINCSSNCLNQMRQLETINP